MDTKPQTSCIIPFFNEDERLYAVLDEAVKVKSLSEIICVDDGSREDHSQEVVRHFPDVKFIRLEKNGGKSGAVREGLKRATGELIFLCDADLRNLDHHELEGAIDAMQAADIDMLILRRVNSLILGKLFRGNVILSGTRILPKRDLEAVLAAPVKGWQLEVAINQYMYTRGKKSVWMPYSAINTCKPQKRSLTDAVKQDFRTAKDVVTAAGLFNLIRLALFFARKELKINL